MGFSTPFLGICWKSIGKRISQKWEHFGKLKWNIKIITSLGNHCNLFPEVGKLLEKQQGNKIQQWEIIGKLQNKINVSQFWEIIVLVLTPDKGIFWKVTGRVFQRNGKNWGN